MTGVSSNPKRQWAFLVCSLLLFSMLHGCGGTAPQTDAIVAESDKSKSTATVPAEEVNVEPAPVVKASKATKATSSESASPPVVSLSSAPIPQRFRLPDDRPKLDRDVLMAEGLRIVESKHLVLVTDLPLETVADLPPLTDALFATLEKRLGKLAPDIAGTTFQVTGFLIDARERFERADVLPPEQFEFRHGRHLGYRFWINNQPVDYYRRHLMLHEFVHCFLMCEYGMRDIPPLWYTEGIAEYYATHQLQAEITKSEFGILLSTSEGFDGWHRIAEIRRQFNQDPSATGELAGIVPLQTVLHPPDSRFQDDSQYANAWALVWLINHHPELQTDFAEIATCRTQQQFDDAIEKIPEFIWKQLHQVWSLYLDGLEEADVADVRFPALSPLKSHQSNVDDLLTNEYIVNVDEQWVSTGLVLAAGQKVVIRCQGRYVVEETTKPWVSEADGITIDYVRGRPLGEVIGVIISADGTKTTRHIPIGAATTLDSPIDGILWLQVNDHWSKRAKNHGTVTVQVSTVSP